ncbi:histone-like nucleoid-structuring protein Lsr2 [Streptomyces murinus]|uniref:histone-like nucleoid-structuring protein Lsr2 n=1 Tax=Streptomyces murinus TaxID=33900 RepID=UPI0037F3C9A9
MARKIMTVYTDDLTDTQSDEVSTHRFSLNGVQYEIDLTPESYDKLDAALRPFIEKGRKVKRVRGTENSRQSQPIGGAKAEEVRAWARENGYEVSNRGRVPREIHVAFEAAH